MRLAALVGAVLGWNAITGAAARRPSDAVLLSQVKSLTLRNGRKTASRRVSAIPQLRCTGGNGKGHHQVDVMRCTNVGSDYDQDDVQWTCQANLPVEFKLGSTEVMCEGYDSPDDPYVLKGSCGVEYKLILTELGEQRYGYARVTSLYETVVSSAVLFFIFAVVAYIIWVTCIGGNNHGRPIGGHQGGRWDGGPGNGPGGGGGGGGNGFDDGHNDPPPPYTPGRGWYTKRQTSSNPSGSSGQQPQGQGNFWLNTLGGAAAGYLAGRLTGGNRRGEAYGDQYRHLRRGGWGGNGYDSGGGGGFGHRPDFGRSSSSSGSVHQSTGFGGTTRR